jgi:hypothetical protein
LTREAPERDNPQRMASIFHAAESLASSWVDHGVDGHSAPFHPHSVGIVPLVLTLLVLAVVGFVGARRRWRDAAALSLAGLLSVLAVETAVHSVHHLDDPLALQTCVVFASGSHVDGTGHTLPNVDGPTWTPFIAPLVDRELVSSLLWFRPDEGRAPPAALPG